jgi:hypothetical protein
VLEHAAATLVDEGALGDPHVVRGGQRVVPMEVVAALAAAAAVLGVSSEAKEQEDDRRGRPRWVVKVRGLGLTGRFRRERRREGGAEGYRSESCGGSHQGDGEREVRPPPPPRRRGRG